MYGRRGLPTLRRVMCISSSSISVHNGKCSESRGRIHQARGDGSSTFDGILPGGNAMGTHLFDSGIVGSTQVEALDFIGSVLQSSTEYSIIAGGLDGQILLWNEGARRVYGYAPEEVIAKVSWDVLFTPEDVRAGKPAG